MADVFLSYKKEDRVKAAAIVGALRESGKTVWWDEGLTPRQAWDATIEREIADAAKVIVLWSPRSVVSDWVRTEAHYAQDKGKLVPVLIEPCTIPLAFMLRQAVDLSHWRGSPDQPVWQRLLGWLDEDRFVEPSPNLASPARQARPGRLMRAVLPVVAALLAVTAAIAGWHMYRSWAPEANAPSVRVSALSSPPGDTAAASFSQGFAADLAQIMTSGGSKLRVVDGFGTSAPAASTADFTLAGNVRSEGGKLRATLTLNSPEDGAIIWSTSLERPLGQVDVMHQEAEVRMGSVFVCALDENARDRTIVPLDALKVYLQACEALPGSDVENARKLLRDVTRLAPSYAQGWATLAEWAAFMIEFGNGDAVNANRKEALDAASRALTLDPHNATAWTARSMTKIEMSEWLSAQSDLSKAFALNPNEPIGNYFAAAHLRNVGRLSEALVYAQRGANSGPRFWPKTLQVIEIMTDLGDTDGAMQMLLEARKTWPDNWGVKREMLDVATKYLDPKRAMSLLADPALADAAPPWRLNLYRLELAARIKPTPKRIAAANEAINTGFGGANDTEAGLLHLISIERVDDAFNLMRQLPRPLSNAPYLPNPSAFFAPVASKFRSDARFVALARQQGLAAVWLATGNWPDFCAAATAPYNCQSVMREGIR